METGKDLKNWRRRHNMTQAEFARKAGYRSVSHISRVESGKEPFSKRLEKAVCAVNAELHPKDDVVTEAWKDLRSYGYMPVKKEVDSLSDMLPDLLSLSDIEEINVKAAYMEFLAHTVDILLKIKKGEPLKDRDSFINEIMPLIKEIYKGAYNYLKTKAQYPLK